LLQEKHTPIQKLKHRIVFLQKQSNTSSKKKSKPIEQICYSTSEKPNRNKNKSNNRVRKKCMRREREEYDGGMVVGWPLM
jgi:hypothetical protein